MYVSFWKFDNHPLAFFDVRIRNFCSKREREREEEKRREEKRREEKRREEKAREGKRRQERRPWLAPPTPALPGHPRTRGSQNTSNTKHYVV